VVEQVVNWCVQGCRMCIYRKFIRATHTLYDHSQFRYHRLDLTPQFYLICVNWMAHLITHCRPLDDKGLYCPMHEYKQYDSSVNVCCLQ
jgi:hypothetical protein